LALTQEEIATRYHIPLHSPDWEQGRAQPDRPTQAYLKIIACHANRFYNRVAIVAFEKRFRSRQNT